MSTAVVDFEADARHANPMGTLHGGVLCVECDVTDAEDVLVAHATSTCLTLRGANADGRTFSRA